MASYTVHESRLDQSSQGLLDKLDELLADCTPLEVENAFGPDYAAQLEELKKVS